ncbi:hypothetical protein T439DRAFT_329881 [Meredithblackwellia eburnea MCA 4105]
MFGGEAAQPTPAQLALSRQIARQTFLSGFLYVAGIIRAAPFAIDFVKSLWK